MSKGIIKISYKKIPPSEEELDNMMQYAKELDFNWLFGTSWDKAKEVDVSLQNSDYAQYVLSGEFLKSCQNNVELDDEVMCNINKDIHNRIYSLLINGYFDWWW